MDQLDDGHPSWLFVVGRVDLICQFEGFFTEYSASFFLFFFLFPCFHITNKQKKTNESSLQKSQVISTGRLDMHQDFPSWEQLPFARVHMYIAFVLAGYQHISTPYSVYLSNLTTCGLLRSKDCFQCWYASRPAVITNPQSWKYLSLSRYRNQPPGPRYIQMHVCFLRNWEILPGQHLKRMLKCANVV